MSNASSLRAVEPRRAAAALLNSITGSLRQLEERADLPAATAAAGECALLVRTVSDRSRSVRRLASALETMTANIRDGRAPCGSGLPRALIVASGRLGEALGLSNGLPDEETAERALTELTDALASAADPTRSNYFLGPRPQYINGTAVPPAPAPPPTTRPHEAGPSGPLPEGAENGTALVAVANDSEVATVRPDAAGTARDEPIREAYPFELFLPPLGTVPDTGDSEVTATAQQGGTDSRPPAEEAHTHELSSGFTPPAATGGPRANAVAPATAGPRAELEGQSIEQLLDAVDVLRTQKAELEEKENALLKVLFKKVESLNERLAVLSGGAPPLKTTGTDRD